MSQDTESPSNFLASLQDVLLQAGQIIDLRLALLIGLFTFFVAVGFDSSGNQAEAADLLRQNQAAVPPAVTIVDGNALNRTGDLDISASGPVTSTGGLVTARRLRHGTLTGAVMTSNRLTQAHFFTDLPSSQ